MIPKMSKPIPNGQVPKQIFSRISSQDGPQTVKTIAKGQVPKQIFSRISSLRWFCKAGVAKIAVWETP